jgi:hypothetical protein
MERITLQFCQCKVSCHSLQVKRLSEHLILYVILPSAYCPEKRDYSGTCMEEMADPSGRAVCGRSLAGIVRSNPAEDMDVCLL